MYAFFSKLGVSIICMRSSFVSLATDIHKTKDNTIQRLEFNYVQNPQ